MGRAIDLQRAANGGTDTGESTALDGHPAANHLAGLRLINSRVIWLGLAIVSMGLLLASLPTRFDELANPSAAVRAGLEALNFSVSFYAGYYLALEVLFAVVFTVVAVVIFWRKSHDWVAVFISMMLLLVGHASYPILPTMESLVTAHPEFMVPVRVLTYIAWTLVFIFFCIFPDGKFKPRWTLGLAAFAVLINVPWDLFPDQPFSPWNWPPVALLVLEIGIWGSCIFAQGYRYGKLSDAKQRHQIKWVVYGVTASVVGILSLFVPRIFSPWLATGSQPQALMYQLVSATGNVLFALLTPLAIGISILRYKLWNIDLIINRTLVYVPLTGIIAGLYSASVALFQKIFTVFLGERSDAAIILTTLFLAATFTPIKNGVQSFVDNRFKQLPDKAAELKEFNKQVKAVVEVIDARSVTERLLEKATEAFNATGGAIYRGTAGHLSVVHATDGWSGNARISVPLENEGEWFGLLSLGPRKDGQDYSTEDRQLLEQTADLVASAIDLVTPEPAFDTGRVVNRGRSAASL